LASREILWESGWSALILVPATCPNRTQPPLYHHLWLKC